MRKFWSAAAVPYPNIRTATDLDIPAFRFSGAGRIIPGEPATGRRRHPPFTTDPLLKVPDGCADMSAAARAHAPCGVCATAPVRHDRPRIGTTTRDRISPGDAPSGTRPGRVKRSVVGYRSPCIHGFRRVGRRRP